MSALTAAAAAVAGGFAGSLAQFAASPWALIPLGVAVAMGAASWHLGRRSRITHLVFLPPAEEVGDDTLAMLAQKPQAAPWPDGDTVTHDGMADELDRMLRGDGRNG